MSRHFRLQILCAVFLIFVTGADAKAEVDFKREIRPILEENCWHCHGEDESESGLRLDRRAFMLRGGDSGQPALVPGKPEESYFLHLVRHQEPGLEMPPEDDPLPAASIKKLTDWVREGAVWPGQMQDKVAALPGSDHWSFQPVKRPAVPAGPGHPIDRFLSAQHKENGLKANPQADARTLLRRASIVLTGLNPTPGQVARFQLAAEQDFDSAYAAVIERLLASPHFGERWAQHWLDVIRWAETNGSESNLYRKNAWVYRDYVIRSFNEDKPYDQFVREQIAGDTMQAGEALGFLVAGPHVPAATVGQEASAIRQARADRMDEIMQTVGASMMGLTIGCARCHNHKFDPVSITDYYALTGIFQDIEFGSRFPEYSDSNIHKQRSDQVDAEITRARKVLQKTGGWLEDWGAYRELHFAPTTTKSIRIEFKTPYVGVDELEVFGPKTPELNLAHRKRGTQVSGPDEMVGDPRNVITRINDGEYGTMAWRARSPKGSKDRPWAQYDFKEPVAVNRIRISSNREYFYETDYLEKMPGLAFGDFDVSIQKPDGIWKKWVSTWWVNKKLPQDHPERATGLQQIAKLIEISANEKKQAFVGRFVEPQVTHVLHRGSPENPKSVVMPAGPVVLNGDLSLTSDSAGTKRRREFADWIVQPNHPLTARVMVNRIWHHVFGTGLVSTTSDFGTAGAKPSDPQLLDWLAAEFVAPQDADAKPWSMKDLIRRFVMTDAFRRSNQPNADNVAKDSGNRFLWRYAPRRAEAEVIRDSILQASGELDHTIGGIGYRIHNVKKTYAQWEVVNNHGPHTFRRMIYQERMRRVDDRMFTAFDFPDCGQVRAKRPVSTTPLQALNLMNSAFVMDQSKRLANRALVDVEKKTSDDQLAGSVHRCFEFLLCRAPDSDELTTSVAVAKEHGLPVVCRALMNSNEFSFIP